MDCSIAEDSKSRLFDNQIEMEADNEASEAGTAEDVVDFSSLGDSWMCLAKTSFSIFQDIVQQRESTAGNGKSDLNSILADSSRYLSLVEEIRQQLFDTLEEGTARPEIQDHLQEELQAFSYLILVWRMCQIVFLEHMEDFKSPLSATYVPRLMTFRDSIGPPLRTMPQNVDCETNDSQIWQTVLRFILIGQLEEAMEALSRLSRRAKDSPSVECLRTILQDAPLFTDSVEMDSIEAWRLAISDVLMEDVVSQDREVSRLLRILLGNFENWAVIGHEFTSWLSFYISRLPYSSGLVSPTALAVDHHQFSEAYGACQVKSFPTQIDLAFECALRLDWDGMFEVLRKFFRNTWFTVHMWDIFHHSKCLISAEKVDRNFSSKFREALLVEYSESAILNGHWLPFLRYFKFCSPEGLTRLKHLLNIVDFRSVEERADVIATLQTDAMTLALQEIHRRDAVSFVRKSDFQSALRAAQLTDEEFRLRIANEYVQFIRHKRGGVKFVNEDKPNLLLLPDCVLERIGVPGIATLYDKAIGNEDHHKALSCLLQLLKRTFRRDEIYDLVFKLIHSIRQIRLSRNDLHVKVYQQIRQWLMVLPLTNLKPTTEPEKSAIAELQDQVCGSTAWSVDEFSTSNLDRSVSGRLEAIIRASAHTGTP